MGRHQEEGELGVMANLMCHLAWALAKHSGCVCFWIRLTFKLREELSRLLSPVWVGLTSSVEGLK